MYYLQSRYYDSKICRFINADVYISTGYGLIGNNMFAYCNNNPVCYSDHEGTDISYECLGEENDYNPTNDWRYEGGGSVGGNSNGATAGSAVGYGNTGNGTSTLGGLPASASASSRTEVHHIVEQCQTYKSGFSNDMIQANSNKVVLDYSVHRKISGFYSSKPEWTNGIRVRDWLAGQSFEFQTRYGWQIVQMYRGY